MSRSKLVKAFQDFNNAVLANTTDVDFSNQIAQIARDVALFFNGYRDTKEAANFLVRSE